MSKPLGAKIDTNPLTEPEYQALRNVLPAKWRTCFDFLWITGVRVEEALLIESKDLLPNNTVAIVREKRTDHRQDAIPVPSWLWNEMYLLWRDHPRSKRIWLQSRYAAWAALRVAAHRAGIRETIHPHLYRHGFGVRARQAGIHYQVIAEMLGHSSLRYVHRYMKPGPAELAETFKKLNQ